jgi:hypothetical protein
MMPTTRRRPGHREKEVEPLPGPEESNHCYDKKKRK